MAGETILVIDAGPELSQQMTGALEAKGYLVFTDSSRVVTAEIVRQLSPSLIYVNPPELSPAGFEFCRAIHNNPPLKDVPIVILGSLETTLRKKEGPRYFREYGIVDFLKLTFDSDELIKKTKEILGEVTPSQLDKEDTSAPEYHLSPKAVEGTGKKAAPPFFSRRLAQSFSW